MLDGHIVIGRKEEISENLFLLPVYKVKIMNFNLTNNDTSSGNCVFISPICLLKIFNNDISIIDFSKNEKNEFDHIPDLFSNIDLSSLIKNIKIN